MEPSRVSFDSSTAFIGLRALMIAIGCAGYARSEERSAKGAVSRDRVAGALLERSEVGVLETYARVTGPLCSSVSLGVTASAAVVT